MELQIGIDIIFTLRFMFNKSFKNQNSISEKYNLTVLKDLNALGYN